MRPVSPTKPAALPRWRDPARWAEAADIIAVLIALSLPWSTSLVSIFTVAWVIAVLPTIDRRQFLKSLKTPAATAPLAFVALAVLAMLWADVAWNARTHSSGQVLKFLLVPLLLYRYQRSSRGPWVFAAFLMSCAALLILSFALALGLGSVSTPAMFFGVPVKNYIDQSQEFSLCAVALGYPILHALKAGRRRVAAALAVLALGFVANLVFVISSRTALVSLPILMLVFAFQFMKWRGVVASLLAVAVLGSAAWIASPRLRDKLISPITEYARYDTSNEATSVGLRLEFWKKSFGFFTEAPVIGHGTGSIESLFARAATGPKGTATAEIIRNPHNQTLAAAVQWGTAGIIMLYAMWLIHLLLFTRPDSMMASVGLLVVVQNIVTSLFNSHLFDFHEGWMYVMGVGIAGADVLRRAGNTSNADRVALPSMATGGKVSLRW